MGQRRALITGITGQDGSYLAEFLFEKRLPRHRYGAPSSTESFERIAHLRERIDIREGDLLDQLSLDAVYGCGMISYRFAHDVSVGTASITFALGTAGTAALVVSLATRRRRTAATPLSAMAPRSHNLRRRLVGNFAHSVQRRRGRRWRQHRCGRRHRRPVLAVRYKFRRHDRINF